MPNPNRVALRPRDIAGCISAFLQEGDLEGLVSMFHPDCHVFFPPGQPPSIGLEGVRRAFEPFLATKPVIQSEVISEVIVRDIALTRANWKVVAPDGTVLGQGQSTEVARRLENGGWGYLIDCPNGPSSVAQVAGRDHT